jgi:hypothetical protein
VKTGVSKILFSFLAMVHVYVRPDGLASVMISDSEYPQRVAHTLLSKVRID